MNPLFNVIHEYAVMPSGLYRNSAANLSRVYPEGPLNHVAQQVRIGSAIHPTRSRRRDYLYV